MSCNHTLDKHAKGRHPQDDSLATLERLIRNGYDKGVWHINEPLHKKVDICDAMNGKIIDLARLVENLRYAAPIFEFTHVGCYCYLMCYSSNNDKTFIVVDWKGTAEEGRVTDKSNPVERKQDFLNLYQDYRTKFDAVKMNPYLTGTFGDPDIGIYSFDIQINPNVYDINNQREVEDEILSIILNQADKFHIKVDRANPSGNHFIVQTDKPLNIYDFTQEELRKVDLRFKKRRMTLEQVMSDLDNLEDWLVFTQDEIHKRLIELETEYQGIANPWKDTQSSLIKTAGIWIDPNNQVIPLGSKSHWDWALDKGLLGEKVNGNTPINDISDEDRLALDNKYNKLFEQGWIRISDDYISGRNYVKPNMGDLGITCSPNRLNAVENWLIENLALVRKQKTVSITDPNSGAAYMYKFTPDEFENKAKMYLSNLKRMSRKTSGKQVGTLYHFTSLLNCLGILKENKFIGNPYISFTRNKNLLNYAIGRGIKSSVLIVIDGDKLSDSYKIEPYNDFAPVPGIPPIIDKYYHPTINENEERVKGEILNANNYILEIIIHNDLDLTDPVLKNAETELIEVCKELNILINYNKIRENYNISSVKTSGKQVGTLYHHTSIDNLVGILKSNQMLPTIIGEDENRNIKAYVSFTRNKNMISTNEERGLGGIGALMVMDGDKLSNNYKIAPYSQYGDIAQEKDKEDRRQGKPYEPSEYVLPLHKHPEWDESEERVPGVINNVSFYIEGIILDENMIDDTDVATLQTINELAEKHNIWVDYQLILN